MKEDILKIINYYGVSRQLKELNKETYELSEAILLEVGDIESLNKITKAIANIYVLLEQFEEYYEINQENIIGMESYKIRKSLEEIKNETIK